MSVDQVFEINWNIQIHLDLRPSESCCAGMSISPGHASDIPKVARVFALLFIISFSRVNFDTTQSAYAYRTPSRMAAVCLAQLFRSNL